MGNKKKTEKTGEVNMKTKSQKIKREKIISEITEASNNKETSKNDDRTERKNKKLSFSNNIEVDKSFNGESEEDSETKIHLNVVDKKKDKRKKRNLVELSNVEHPKVKKVKGIKEHVPNDKQMEPKSNDDVALQKNVINKNKLSFLNQDEAEVKDEDIDKFCDEITEEDNKTYENWVQLFEANFKKKKNVTA